MMYVVTAVKDVYETDGGVEVAGVFDTEEKAEEAKASVRQYLFEEGFYDCKVFILPCEVNYLTWYGLEERI